MVDFNRNEFEQAIAFVSKHNRYFLGDDEKLRKTLTEMVNEIVESEGRLLSTSTMGFRVSLNTENPLFVAKIETDLTTLDGCWTD